MTYTREPPSRYAQVYWDCKGKERLSSAVWPGRARFRRGNQQGTWHVFFGVTFLWGKNAMLSLACILHRDAAWTAHYIEYSPSTAMSCIWCMHEAIASGSVSSSMCFAVRIQRTCLSNPLLLWVCMDHACCHAKVARVMCSWALVPCPPSLLSSWRSFCVSSWPRGPCGLQSARHLVSPRLSMVWKCAVFCSQAMCSCGVWCRAAWQRNHKFWVHLPPCWRLYSARNEADEYPKICFAVIWSHLSFCWIRSHKSHTWQRVSHTHDNACRTHDNTLVTHMTTHKSHTWQRMSHTRQHLVTHMTTHKSRTW